MSTTQPAELVCMLCAGSFPSGELCRTHPDEVLLDPSQEAVLDLMEAEDGRRLRRLLGIGMTIGVLVGLPFAFVAISAFGALTIILSGNFYPFITPIVGLGVLGTASSVGASIAGKQYVPRFRPWLDKVGRAGHQ